MFGEEQERDLLTQVGKIKRHCIEKVVPVAKTGGGNDCHKWPHPYWPTRVAVQREIGGRRTNREIRKSSNK